MTGVQTCALPICFSADAEAGDLVSLRLLAADSAVSYLFDSRNFGTASARPALSIVAAPEPGVCAMFTLGAIVLFGAKGRRPKRPE